MKIATIEIDDNFKDAIQFTCIGAYMASVNVCSAVKKLDDGCHFIISKEGKIVQLRGEIR